MQGQRTKVKDSASRRKPKSKTARVSSVIVKDGMIQSKVRGRVSRPQVKGGVSRPQVKGGVSRPKVKGGVSRPEVKDSESLAWTRSQSE